MVLPNIFAFFIIFLEMFTRSQASQPSISRKQPARHRNRRAAPIPNSTSLRRIKTSDESLFADDIEIEEFDIDEDFEENFILMRNANNDNSHKKNRAPRVNHVKPNFRRLDNGKIVLVCLKKNF